MDTDKIENAVSQSELIEPLGTGWRLIETAPINEIGVLGYEKLQDGFWVITPMYFTDNQWKIVQFHHCNEEKTMNPTHWMPLPAPPEST